MGYATQNQLDQLKAALDRLADEAEDAGQRIPMGKAGWGGGGAGQVFVCATALGRHAADRMASYAAGGVHA